MSYHFDKARHIHKFGDKNLYGVTSVLQTISKPQLIPWAAGMATEYVKGRWKVGKAYSKEERDEILEQAKNAHTRKKEKSGDIGTTAHAAVEVFTKTGQEYTGEDPQISEMSSVFIQWAKDNNAIFIESEMNVWSERLWIGGILDFIVEIDGKKYIGDLKTSSGIYIEHFLQAAAYDLCLEEMGRDDIHGYVIVNIDKSGGMKTMFRTDRDELKAAFEHCLGLHKSLKKLAL